MSNEIIIIWIGSVFISCLLTCAITLFYKRGKIEVVEVKEIIRTPFDVLEFRQDFLFENWEKRGMFPGETLERECERVIYKLINSIPKEVFEIIEWPEHFNYNYGKRKFTIKIKILPPKK